MPMTPVSSRKTVTTAGTAVALGTDHSVCQQLLITPLRTNTQAVFVGGTATLKTAGAEKGASMSPTHDGIELRGVRLDEVYVDALVSGEGVTFTYVQ